jgi:NADP-reducing hydrogenase subunit HndD
VVTLTIDGKSVQVPENTTVLEAARQVGIRIPTLCYLKGVNEIGACRMCVVKVARARSLQAACVLPVSEGMEVFTHTPDVVQARRVNLELILSNHDRRCLECTRNRTCELQALAEELNIDDIAYKGQTIDRPIDTLSPSIERDPNKCILCRRCVATCHDVQKVGVIGPTGRGFKTIIEPVFGRSISEVPCINCGQCVVACPVGALREKDNTRAVWKALQDPEKHVIVQTAPAVRAALGEEFGMPMGVSVTGKMAAALRLLGFAKVYDTDFAADLTIMEEGTELLQRIQNGGKLPLITSCSPGWIKFCEHYYPGLLDNLSSCKSPHEMLGAVIKSYYAEKNGIDPANIVVVSIMPCTAKKYECQRPELCGTEYPDVDIVLTTRELAKMIKQAGIDFANLEDENFDEVLGDSTGAAVIFGTTGGVMEAALRTVADILTGQDLQNIDYTAVRGTEAIKEATVKIGDLDVKVAVAHGTGNARPLLDKILAGEGGYHFVEIMGCPGGCVTGGGQPFVPAKVKMDINPAEVRAKALYDEDAGMPLRKSHKNPSITKIYEEYFGEPCGHKSHELLHTHYFERPKYAEK